MKQSMSFLLAISKRGFGGCGHGFSGCDGFGRLGGFGGFSGLGGFSRFDGFGGFSGFDGYPCYL